VIIQDQLLESLKGYLEQVNARKAMVWNIKFGKKINNEVFFLHTSKHNNNLGKYNQLKRGDNISWNHWTYDQMQCQTPKCNEQCNICDEWGTLGSSTKED
jgi:hypothetical protein